MIGNIVSWNGIKIHTETNEMIIKTLLLSIVLSVVALGSIIVFGLVTGIDNAVSMGVNAAGAAFVISFAMNLITYYKTPKTPSA